MSTPAVSGRPGGPGAEHAPEPQVRVHSLSLSYRDGEDWLEALREISLEVAAGSWVRAVPFRVAATTRSPPARPGRLRSSPPATAMTLRAFAGA